MRSESEARWVRAKNSVGGIPKISDWHVIIPGLGSTSIPPGTVCETALTGSLQFESHAGVKTLDGRRHPVCEKIANRWIKDIDPSPGPAHIEPDPEPLAPPKTTYTEMRRRTL